jgi:hypothetical protein
MATLGFGNYRSEERALKYRTSFGHCPSRAAGTLTLQLMKIFEAKHSLKDLKQAIVSQKLKEKHYLSDYDISYDPLNHFIFFKFNCPRPLMKVHVYKNEGLDSYEAILVENGELFDSTYVDLLKAENKVETPLPSLALPIAKLQEGIGKNIAQLIKNFDPTFRKKMSEMIIKDDETMVLILSFASNPSSVFLGEGSWETKLEKLKRIVEYMETNKKIPSVINLTNEKKVVVKFSDTF